MSNPPQRPQRKDSPPPSPTASDTSSDFAPLSRQGTNENGSGRSSVFATGLSGSVSSLAEHFKNERSASTASLASLARYSSREEAKGRSHEAQRRLSTSSRDEVLDYLAEMGHLRQAPKPHPRHHFPAPPLSPAPQLPSALVLHPDFFKTKPRKGPPPKRPPRPEATDSEPTISDTNSSGGAFSVSKKEERFGSGRRALIYGFAAKN